MEFEFDPAKSDANLRKHGINHLVAGPLERYRLISVRHSRPEEVQLY